MSEIQAHTRLRNSLLLLTQYYIFRAGVVTRAETNYQVGHDDHESDLRAVCRTAQAYRAS